MIYFTQLRNDLTHEQEIELHNQGRCYGNQKPVQMALVQYFRKQRNKAGNWYDIVFGMTSCTVIWTYQSEADRDKDYNFLHDNYVKRSW